MKVAVKVTIEMTPEQVEELTNEYGIDADAGEVREFVKSYIRTQAQEAAAAAFWTATAT